MTLNKAPLSTVAGGEKDPRLISERVCGYWYSPQSWRIKWQKNMENEMEALGPFKGVYKDIQRSLKM